MMSPLPRIPNSEIQSYKPYSRAAAVICSLRVQDALPPPGAFSRRCARIQAGAVPTSWRREYIKVEERSDENKELIMFIYYCLIHPVGPSRVPCTRACHESVHLLRFQQRISSIGCKSGPAPGA
jgi:hypothetical protein